MATFYWIFIQNKKDDVCFLRMVFCSLTYGTPSLPKNTTIRSYLSMPVSRVFQLDPLPSGSSYWVYLVCQDREDAWHSSNTVYFTTGMLFV